MVADMGYSGLVESIFVSLAFENGFGTAHRPWYRPEYNKMTIYASLTLLIASECMSPFTKGDEIVGRTRLGSFFQDCWMKQPYGTTPSANKIIAPRFQRDATAWDAKKKREFIRAIIDGVSSLGHFIIFNMRDDGTLALLDGQHRLTTVQSFIDGVFNLGKKKEIYENLTDAQKDIIHNTISDVKIYYHLSLDEERDKYFQLNASAPLSPEARLHAHCDDEQQPIFKWCDNIRNNPDNDISVARIRELTQVGVVSRQTAENRLLPIISLLVVGKTNKAKKDHATLAALDIPADMGARLRALSKATSQLDSSNNALSKFIGPIAYDINQNWGNDAEVNACVNRWDALIKRCKTHTTTAWDEAIAGVHRPNNEVTQRLLNERCERIRELYDEDGSYIGDMM